MLPSTSVHAILAPKAGMQKPAACCIAPAAQTLNHSTPPLQNNRSKSRCQRVLLGTLYAARSPVRRTLTAFTSTAQCTVDTSLRCQR
jgi:hypothetical protein